MRITVFLISVLIHSIVLSQQVNHVGPKEFSQLIHSRPGIVLDVRTPGEVARGTIANSSHIDFYDPDFRRKAIMIQKGQPLYVYCASGGRSSGAAKQLLELGFEQVYNLDGGIRQWQAAGYPISKATTIEEVNSVSEEDFRAVLLQNDMTLVDFHTVWCSPCKMMAPIIDEIEMDLSDQINVVKIDADKSKSLAQKNGVVGVPVFIVFKGEREVWRHTGIIAKDDLLKKLNELK